MMERGKRDPEDRFNDSCCDGKEDAAINSYQLQDLMIGETCIALNIPSG